ncbi:hypothetical protein PoB_004910800 [Plakobranchus ocellatus]|uniref:Uncharacterized protein n=1 Tax=Plakobranchus ocellatus TaxID=259542 RepID=A0AAV4BUX7_9GAST|nr:hypothetical protein PoB_004910800 [Plakobranchus ocellatus]
MPAKDTHIMALGEVSSDLTARDVPKQDQVLQTRLDPPPDPRLARSAVGSPPSRNGCTIYSHDGRGADKTPHHICDVAAVATARQEPVAKVVAAANGTSAAYSSYTLLMRAGGEVMDLRVGVPRW